jgi:tetratricopeptide (TPR) repeat protein
MRRNPANARFCRDRGVQYENWNRSEEAVVYLEAVARAQDSADAYFDLGLCYQKQKKYDEAIGNFTKSVERKPDQNYWAWANRAACHLNRAGKIADLVTQQNDYRRAIDDASRAIGTDGNTAYAFAMRGAAYRRSGGNLAWAEADLKKALQLNPQDAFAADELRLLPPQLNDGWKLAP